MTPSAAAATSPPTWGLQHAFHDLQHAPADGLDCSFCHTHGYNLAACSLCLSTLYCGRSCQQKHWLAGHQRECSAKAHSGFQNFVRAMEKQQQQQQQHHQQQSKHLHTQECPPSAAGDSTWVRDRNTRLTTRSVDTWLQEMGRVGFAAASASSSRPSSTSSPTAATAATSSKLPSPGLEGLRTLCILANGSIPFLQQQARQRQPRDSSCSDPLSSPPSSSFSTDSVAARMYLKTLAVRGQLSLRPGNELSKQETAVKKIVEALTKHQEAAQQVPNWTVRLLLVAGRLLCALGRRPDAVALLETHIPLLDASLIAAPLSVAYLWLQYTQWLYYDQCAWMDKPRAAQQEAAAKVQAACRRALLLLYKAKVVKKTSLSSSLSSSSSISSIISPSPSPSSSSSSSSSCSSDSPHVQALIATATFRLADLLLEHGAAAEALDFCRLSLRNAAPIHFRTLAVYLAAALETLGQGGKTEAAVEIRVEKERRKEMEAGNKKREPFPLIGPLPRSSSLLNLRGLEDIWSLPAESWWHTGSQSRQLPHFLCQQHRYNQQQHQVQRQQQQRRTEEEEEEEEETAKKEERKKEKEKQLHRQQQQQHLGSGLTTEDRGIDEETADSAMEVCVEEEEAEPRQETTEAIPSTANPGGPVPHPPPSEGASKSAFGMDLPPHKRLRSHRYPIFHQLASCVALPWWAVSAHN